MSDSPESRPDYAKLAHQVECWNDSRKGFPREPKPTLLQVGRALQACAADLAAAEKERDEAQKLAADRLAGMDRYIFQRDRAEQNTEAAEAELEREQAEHVECELALERAEADRDRFAAALGGLVDRPEVSEAWEETRVAREALAAKEQQP